MMNMKMKTPEDTELLNYFIRTRNIQNSTGYQYKIYLTQYCNYYNMTLTELLEEAENEEEQGIRWKHRRLKKRLIEYRQYLYNKYSNSTAQTRFTRIKAFYKHNDIEIHNLPVFNTRNTHIERQIEYEDLLSKEELREIIDHTTSPIMKPLILFMTSSGCARAETLSLTIQDYINATSEYHKGGGLYNILNTIQENTNEILPVWRIKRLKTNKYYTTFSSPESTRAINNYLLSRKDTLTPETQLFKINEDYIVQLCININNELNLGMAGTYNRVRTHMFRKYHASTLLNDGMSRDMVNDLQGRTKPKTDMAYFFNNTETLKEEYIKHLPALTVMQEVEKITIKSPEVQLIESKNKELEDMNLDLQERVSMHEERYEGILARIESLENQSSSEVLRRFPRVEDIGKE